MPETPEQREANKRAAQQVIDVWDGDDLDVLDDVVAEDVVADIVFPGQVRGREAFKEVIHTYTSVAFPDLTPEVNDIVAEDDKVIVHYTARGTHEGELMGIEPTGTEVEASGFVLYRFEDGTIVEVTNIGDLFGLLNQLGVVEPPEE